MPRSLALAQALESFIRRVIPGTEPWVSATGLDKGARFMEEIRENLNQAAAGVVCLTRENLTEPWILYEAGALSTKATDRVWTLLLDAEHTSVAAPLRGLNHTKTEREDVLRMVKSIHKTMAATGEKTCTDDNLERYFDAFWPELEQEIQRLQALDPAPRVEQEPTTEILALVREIGDRVGGVSWREEKALAMLHVIFAATVGGAAPPLAGLKQMVNDLQAKAALKSIQAVTPDEPTPPPTDGDRA